MSQNKSTAVMQRRHVTVDKLDYYPTPPWATRAFLREVLGAQLRRGQFEDVTEPACGEGHMVHVLHEVCGRVHASDVHDYGKGFAVGSYVGQGLDVLPLRKTQWVVTNPPFNLAVEFAERALDEASVGVALLLRSAWSEGMERHERLFRDRPPSIIAQYSERVPMVAGRYDPDASTASAYSWFVWEKAEMADRTAFLWIRPGAYERNFQQADLRRWAAWTTKPCQSCLYCKSMPAPAWRNDIRPRCFRPHTMADGKIVDTGKSGVDCSHERDGISEPQRAALDKCGPTGLHWEFAA